MEFKSNVWNIFKSKNQMKWTELLKRHYHIANSQQSDDAHVVERHKRIW